MGDLPKHKRKEDTVWEIKVRELVKPQIILSYEYDLD